MIQKPSFITNSQIIAKLEQDYGLRVTILHFLPVGEASWCYRAGTNRENWFIKLVKPRLYPASILIPNALQVDFVSPALPTLQGHLWTTLVKHTLIVFPYVEGAAIMEGGLPDERWPEV